MHMQIRNFVVISDFYIRTARRRPELLMHNNRLWKRGCGKGNHCGIPNHISELFEYNRIW